MIESNDKQIVQEIMHKLMSDPSQVIDGEKLKDLACFADDLIIALSNFFSENVTRCDAEQLLEVVSATLTLLKLNESLGDYKIQNDD